MQNKSKNPPNWWDIYPQGTKEGDEEQEVFSILTRHKTYVWRSLAQIAKEAKISKERAEEILHKYLMKNMVFQSPTNEDNWGYWTNHPELVRKKEGSNTDKDHENRINKITNTNN